MRPVSPVQAECDHCPQPVSILVEPVDQGGWLAAGPVRGDAHRSAILTAPRSGFLTDILEGRQNQLGCAVVESGLRLVKPVILGGSCW